MIEDAVDITLRNRVSLEIFNRMLREEISTVGIQYYDTSHLKIMPFCPANFFASIFSGDETRLAPTPMRVTLLLMFLFGDDSPRHQGFQIFFACYCTSFWQMRVDAWPSFLALKLFFYCGSVSPSQFTCVDHFIVVARRPSILLPMLADLYWVTLRYLAPFLAPSFNSKLSPPCICWR